MSIFLVRLEVEIFVFAFCVIRVGEVIVLKDELLLLNINLSLLFQFAHKPGEASNQLLVGLHQLFVCDTTSFMSLKLFVLDLPVNFVGKIPLALIIELSENAGFLRHTFSLIAEMLLDLHRSHLIAAAST